MRTTDEDILERQLHSISGVCSSSYSPQVSGSSQYRNCKVYCFGYHNTVDSPTEWCSPAFFVPKGDGKRVRLVTDYTKLNKFVVRPVHPFPSVADIIQSIPASAACFAKLDATHGYFQIPLDEEASRLTTFILPSGRFRYLRAPMGLSSSSD